MNCYAKFRKVMSSGDVVFYRGHGIGPWLIRTATKSNWAHVGIAYWVHDRLFLLESTPFKGVRMVPMSLKVPEIWCETGRHGDWYFNDLKITLALDHIGKKYSFIDCLLAWLNVPLLTRNGLQCSEYVSRVFGKNFSTPEGLYKQIMKDGIMISRVTE